MCDNNLLDADFNLVSKVLTEFNQNVEGCLRGSEVPMLGVWLGRALGHGWRGTGTSELMRLNNQGPVLTWLFLKVLGGALTMY